MWILLALTAGTFQTARNGFARTLAGRVHPALNSWARFAFNLPLSTALVLLLVGLYGLPRASALYFLWCLGTGLSQLLANIALVAAFARATFAQSIVLHKLEVAFTAVIGVCLFGETPSPLGWWGVLVCTAGVLLMNLGRTSGPAGWRRAFHLDAGAVLSLLCALGLVFASFLLKEATAELARLNPRVGEARFEVAAHTLFHVTWMEVLLLSALLQLVWPQQLVLVRLFWRRMALIGGAGFCGSVCWFWAYSIALVAYVKAVGQIEAVLALLLGLVLWHERQVIRQLPGVAVVLAGIVLVLLGSG